MIIVGIVFAGILILILFAAIVKYCICRPLKKRQRRDKTVLLRATVKRPAAAQPAVTPTLSLTMGKDHTQRKMLAGEIESMQGRGSALTNYQDIEVAPDRDISQQIYSKPKEDDPQTTISLPQIQRRFQQTNSQDHSPMTNEANMSQLTFIKAWKAQQEKAPYSPSR